MRKSVPYFHVFVREGDAARRLFLKDLTADAVVRRIVKPYRSGGSLVAGGEIVPVASLRELRIIESGDPFDRAFAVACQQFLRRQEELNAGGGLVFISPGAQDEDMANEWPNVTDRFLNGHEPGADNRPGLIEKVSANPLLSALIAAVGAALVLMYVFGIK
jgi:hypothetical protein